MVLSGLWKGVSPPVGRSTAEKRNRRHSILTQSVKVLVLIFHLESASLFKCRFDHWEKPLILCYLWIFHPKIEIKPSNLSFFAERWAGLVVDSRGLGRRYGVDFPGRIPTCSSRRSPSRNVYSWQTRISNGTTRELSLITTKPLVSSQTLIYSVFVIELRI